MKDEVQCVICGKFFKRITNTHLNHHNMTINEYKIQYPNCKLISDITHKLISDVRKGKNNPNYGHKHSNETKLKWSKDRKGQNLGKNNPSWKGGKITKKCEICGNEFEIIQSSNQKFCSYKCMGKWRSINMIGKNSSHWQGGCDITRPHLTPKNQCIKLNTYFKGSNAHHIMSSVVIYLPCNIHNEIYHNMKSNQGMSKINKLSLDYLIGDEINE